MMKKILFIIFIVFNTLSIWYLFSPLPIVPDLTNAVKSDLPGDTTQLKNVTGYFTNLSRTQVINFYKANVDFPFLIQLNHPPEKAKEVIVDTIQSYYFEEFVLPFKESIYINGYDWQNDVFTKPDKRLANKLIYKGVNYQSKITIKIIPTSLTDRLIGFFSTEIATIFLIYILFSLPWKIKK